MTVNRSKLRAAAEFTRADLGESGTNYPHVRTLLAFAEQHLEAAEPVQGEATQWRLENCLVISTPNLPS